MKKLWFSACMLLAACSGTTSSDDPTALNNRMFNGYPVLPYSIIDYRFENGQSDKVLANIITTLPANNEKVVTNTLEFMRDSIMRSEPQVRMMAIYIYKDVTAAASDAQHSNWQSMLLQVSEKDYKVYHQ